jgi:hypothetical protein
VKTGAVLVGNGDGTFGQRVDFPVTAGAQAPLLTDLDGDNRPDLVTADQSTGCLSVQTGAAAGGFAPPVSFGSGPDPTAIAVSDFDGDGKVDLAAPTRAGNAVTLHRNLGGE